MQGVILVLHERIMALEAAAGIHAAGIREKQPAGPGPGGGEAQGGRQDQDDDDDG